MRRTTGSIRERTITPCVETFELDPSWFVWCLDLPGYREIERRCCHALGALGLAQLPWPFFLFREVLFVK